MDQRDILAATQPTKRLIQDESYYKYIFKKTERIVSVVFYILHNVSNNKKSQVHIEDIEHAARSVHDSILQSLETRVYAAEDTVRSVAHALVSLESKLSVAQVSGVISPEVLSVIHNEIDSVLRGLNRYTTDDSGPLTFGDNLPATTAPATRKPVSKPVKREVNKLSAGGDAVGRRERIQTILEAKGEATIKDISEIITDISEKTVQRELNAMIEDNLVKRQGERRWSRYTLF